MTNTTWLALILWATLPACSGVAPESLEADVIERTDTTAPEGSQAVVPEDGTSSTGKSARGSVGATEGTDEQETPPSEDEPAPEEQEPEAPAAELPEAVVVNSETAADDVDPAVAALPDDQIIDDVTTDDVVIEVAVDANGTGSAFVNTSLVENTDGLLDPCAAGVDGVYCAINLDPSADQKTIVYCKQGALLSVNECNGPCDTDLNACHWGAGSSEGAYEATAETKLSPCDSCLTRACGTERKACEDDPTCFAQWTCLTSCEIANCDINCRLDFARAGDDGQWRSCAVDKCSDECNLSE